MMVRVAVRPCLFSGGPIMHVCVRTMLVATGLWVCVARHVPAQEPVTITGKVTSDAGQPLGQVEVAIPSMGLGGLSRDDGSFTVVVPGARVSGQTVMLVGRRLGYKSQSAQVTLTSGGGGVAHDFVLAANPLQLGEVVVTGAGTSAAANALGSVRNNVAADQIEKASETNMVEALAAKAPNVTVVQQSGDPGASSFINIRGISTLLGNNQPLFVIDGVPSDNSTYSTSNFNAPDDAGGTISPGGQTEGTVATNRAADINPNDIEAVRADALHVPLLDVLQRRQPHVSAADSLWAGYERHPCRHLVRWRMRHAWDVELRALVGPAYSRGSGGLRPRERDFSSGPHARQRVHGLGWKRPDHVLSVG